MLSKDLHTLLTNLPEKSYITAESLSNQMNLSKRTIHTRISELNDILKENGACIESKPRHGIRLRVLDPDMFTAFQEDQGQGQDSHFIPNRMDEREEFLIVYLLNQERYVKSDDICDLLYISKGTLSALMKRVEAWFSKYGISLERRPNYGMRIVGSEQNYRNCLARCMLEFETFPRMAGTAWLDEVQELTGEVLQYLSEPEYKINLSEVAIENFVIHLYISLDRIAKGKTVDMESTDIPHIYNHEWQYLDKLISVLEKRKGVEYTDSERLYMALQLAGKRMIGCAESDEVNIVIKADIQQSVIQMLNIIFTHFGYDFRNNFDTRMQLCQHMIPFDIRMRFGIPLQNPMLDEIKEQHMLGYQMAVVATADLASKYGKEIPEDEIGYFAVIFALAVEKHKLQREKQNILIVCGAGKGSSRMLKFQYQQMFGSELENIYVCDILALEEFDFSKVDYVFTTVPIEQHIPVPVVKVNMFLTDSDKKHIQHVLEVGKAEFLTKYFQRNRFYTDIDGADRETIIRRICERVIKQEQVSDEFTDLVLERERLGATDCGNLVAIPHPLKTVTKTSFVYTVILDKPIKWWRRNVQVVLLIAVGQEDDPDIQKFYEMTTQFITDEKAVRDLIQYKNYDRMMESFNNLHK